MFECERLLIHLIPSDNNECQLSITRRGIPFIWWKIETIALNKDFMYLHNNQSLYAAIYDNGLGIRLCMDHTHFEII